MALSILIATTAQAQTAKVVGHGASACARFNDEIHDNPALEREYFAWAQGFMSRALMRAPSGVDKTLIYCQNQFLRKSR
ncbi:hypothetical protein [Methylobacterium nigriterrae]|uniref:hypothetical protein n=1 Tax=Methylobacterium nigriterrae TaxID=3127512 RepID=UPI00301325C1